MENKKVVILGLALTAAGLLGGLITHLIDFTDRYVTKELFNAKMETVQAQIGGLKDNIDALRAEVRGLGKER